MKLKIIKRVDGSVFIHSDTGINEISKGHSIEQWEPIARAVNLHEELIAALKDSLATLSRWEGNEQWDDRDNETYLTIQTVLKATSNTQSKEAND